MGILLHVPVVVNGFRRGGKMTRQIPWSRAFP